MYTTEFFLKIMSLFHHNLTTQAYKCTIIHFYHIRFLLQVIKNVKHSEQNPISHPRLQALGRSQPSEPTIWIYPIIWRLHLNWEEINLISKHCDDSYQTRLFAWLRKSASCVVFCHVYLDCFFFFFTDYLEGQFTQNLTFTNLLLTPFLMEALLTLSDPHNHSWV